MTTTQNYAAKNVSEYLKTLVSQINTVQTRVNSVLSADGQTLTVANISTDLVNVDNIALNDSINGMDITSIGTTNLIEDCLDASIQAGTLYHDASFDNINNYIVLTNELASSTGQIEYILNPGTIWTSEFEWQYADTGGAGVGGALWMFIYNQSSIANTVNLLDTSGAPAGFSIVFDAAANQIRVNNSGLVLTTVAGPGFGAATWFSIKVVCENGRNFHVYVNGINYINYRSAAFSTSGAYAGFAAYCTAISDVEYRVRNIKLYEGANYVSNSLSSLGNLSILPLTGFSVAGSLVVGTDLSNTGTFTTSGGVVNIGADVTNNAINIGTNSSAARAISIGHNAGTNAISLNSSVINITAATASTNTTSGALVVTGGAGVGGDINVGGDLAVARRSAFSDISTFNDHTHGISHYELDDSQQINIGFTPSLITKTFGSGASLTGKSVDVSDDGNFVCIGSPGDTGNIGRVTIYELHNSSFESISTFTGGGASFLYGSRVAISGNGKWVAATAPGAPSAGVLYIYEKVSNSYVLRVAFNGPSVSSSFGLTGLAMSSDGHVIMVGDSTVAANNGHVSFYELLDGSWSFIGTMASPNGGAEEFGYSIALTSNGSRVVIGAPGSNTNSGRLYQRDRTNATTWNTSLGSDLILSGRGGTSVAVSGDGKYAAYGAPAANSNQGSAGLISNYGNNNDEHTSLPIVAGVGNLLGTSIAISKDGSYVYVGVPGYSSNAGRVVQHRVFNRRVVTTDIVLNGSAGSAFGTSIAVSRASEALIVGGPNEAGNGAFSWFGGPGSFYYSGAGRFTGALTSDGVMTAASAVVNGAASVSGITSLVNGTASISPLTGALVVTGGVGVSGNTYLGGILNVAHRATFTDGYIQNITGTGSAMIVNDDGTLYVFKSTHANVDIFDINEKNILVFFNTVAVSATTLYSVALGNSRDIYYAASDGIRRSSWRDKQTPVLSSILTAHTNAILRTWGQYLIALAPSTNTLIAANIVTGTPQLAAVVLPGATPHYNICISGNLCYVINSGAAATISVYDLGTLPTSITFLGTSVTSCTMGIYPNTACIIENHIVLVGNGSIVSYDIFSPTLIVTRSTLLSTPSTPTSVAFEGLYIYIASGSNVNIYNVSDPTLVTLVGTNVTAITTINSILVRGQSIFILGVDKLARYTIGGISVPQLDVGSLKANNVHIGESIHASRNIYASGSLAASSGVLYTGLHVGRGGASTSTSNGALTVNGGVGITGALYAGGTIEASNFVTNDAQQSTRLNSTGQLGTDSFIAGYLAGAASNGTAGVTLIGSQAGSTANGSWNTAIGSLSLFHATSGDCNTCVGRRAGYNLTTGTGNVFIGYNAYSMGVTPTANSNSVAIGAEANVRFSNEVVFGNTGVTHFRSERTNGVDIGTSTYTFKDLYMGGVIKMTPSVAPLSPSAGWIYYDSGTNKLRVYNGTGWFDCF